MQCAALRRHHVGVHAPLSVETTIITYDTGRGHAHAVILSASCTPVNVGSVRTVDTRQAFENGPFGSSNGGVQITIARPIGPVKTLGTQGRIWFDLYILSDLGGIV